MLSRTAGEERSHCVSYMHVMTFALYRIDHRSTTGRFVVLKMGDPEEYYVLRD